MSDDIFTADFKETPYWWERTPRPAAATAALPSRAEVVVVGSGYTGLSAAIHTAAHGRHTVVIDAEDAGWGCSTRNGGQVSPSIKPAFAELRRRHGVATALAIYREGNNALAWIKSFTADHKIACDLQSVGRFHGAHTPRAFAELRQKIADLPDELNINARIVPPNEQHREIGTPMYHGGVVFPHHACLDPGRYHRGLLACAADKKVEVVGRCRVLKIQHRGRPGGGLRLTTEQGVITADDVILATNGYTGPLSPWHRRRIIPVGSYIIATEPLPPDTLARLIPRGRVVTDTRRLVVYYRACPERRRLLFGGRVSLRETNLRTSARRLHRQMTRLFPALADANAGAGVKVSHSWMGLVGYSFDQLPHSGRQNGIYYSMGYCGSGVSLSGYLGMRTAMQLINDRQGKGRRHDTAFAALPFPARPYYHGNPWFLAPSIFYYRWRDEREVNKTQNGLQ